MAKILTEGLSEERVESGVVAACRRLHAAIDTLDQAAANTLGVSRNDLRCLNLMEKGPLSPTQIAVSLHLTSGSVTALLDRLETKGLVERARDPCDRRAIMVTATPNVFRSMGLLYRSCAEAIEATVQAYPPSERSMAQKHLNDVAVAWEEAAAKGRTQAI